MFTIHTVHISKYIHKCIYINQIKSLLLSHHHSTSALVSEILMSVLQTVQKNNNKQFTYGQTVQKKKLHWSIYSAPDSAKKTTTIYIWTDSAKKTTTTIYIWTDSAAKKLHWSIYSAPDSAKKTNNNLHMDSTYLQTVQKTMCKIHIHILSTQCTIKTHSIISDTLYTVWAHLHYVQYLYIM